MEKGKIDEIREFIHKQDFKITGHAFEEMSIDGLSLKDIVTGVMSGDIIESYPDSYPLPACLINGKTEKGEPIHVCISMAPLVKVITVYRPDPTKWIDGFRKRR